MLKTYFFLAVAGLAIGSASPILHVDVLATLSKLAWVILPVILMFLGNRYFKKRDEEEKSQKEMFKAIDEKIDEFGNALLAQNAQYQGLMAKMEATTDIMTEMHGDVKEHARIISRLQVLLNDGRR